MKNDETTNRIDRLKCSKQEEQQNNNQEQKGYIIKISSILRKMGNTFIETAITHMARNDSK